MSITINNVETFNVYNNTFIPTKVCCQCNQNKPLIKYYKDKSKSDGLRYNCKACHSLINKRYWNNNNNNNNKQINVNNQINANRIYDENEVKICSQYKQSKPITEYNKDRTKSSGLRNICKSCESIAKLYYRDNNRQINANRIFTENDVITFSTCKQQKIIY